MPTALFGAGLCLRLGCGFPGRLVWLRVVLTTLSGRLSAVRCPKISNTVEGAPDSPAGAGRGVTAVSLLVVLIVGAIQLTLVLDLVVLGIVAHRRHQHADVRPEQGWPVPITDEVDVVMAYAATATAAAQHAQEEADQAHHRAVQAAAARDIAEQRHRLTLKHAEEAGEGHQLVQRAALDAYRRGQLSAAELNRIWQHAQATAEPTAGRAAVPLGWELRVHEAQQRYEQAEIDMARAEEEARRKAATAATLAEDAQVAESLLSTAMHSANTGLVGLLRATWADPADLATPPGSTHLEQVALTRR